MTAVYTHPACLRHDPGPFEVPERLAVLLSGLRDHPRHTVSHAAPAPLAMLAEVHTAGHLDLLRDTATAGGGAVGPEAVLSPESWEAVLGAAGSMASAIDHALAGRGHAFAAVRPPGHHALRDRAMGFCLVNNAVAGALHARRRGAARTLIVDWDVHHGNGTQALVERDPSVRFVSMHQYPWYPGTGAAGEHGVGNVFNVPAPPSLPPERYVAMLEAAFRRAVDGWRPDLILVSAGYDCLLGDPLGGFTLEPVHLGGWITFFREQLPDVPIAGVLEGGYIPSRLADGVLATLDALD